MKNNRLSIGQMAKLNHTTLATLRLYDKMGLLSPAYTNPETGYRYYDVTQCATFHMIQNNKNLNMSLKEIKAILDKSDFHFLLKLYHEKMAALDKEFEELERKRRTLKKIADWADFYQHRPPVGTFSLLYMPEHCLYKMPADRNYFQEDFGSFIYGLSQLESLMQKNNFPLVYLYTAFISMKQDEFQQGTYRAEAIGILLGEEYRTCPNVEVKESRMNACVYFDDFTKVHEYLAKLNKYCEQQHYKIIGDASCRIVGTLDVHDFRHPSEYLCLQVPVETQSDLDVKAKN
ncbi:MerR family transcriptional regulator [Mitsuokella sp. WILCCON 0060]|uniref:MerR family transcriptional regulator n=1 Tax=unclassified Mitsuokella TaxID=2637239 RepID=UPI003F01DE5D